jgi:hypothetical protein
MVVRPTRTFKAVVHDLSLSTLAEVIFKEWLSKEEV